MKTNNDERREVAARLRGLAARSQGSLGVKRMGEVLATAQEITGTRGLPSVAHVLERYAELIEPEPERTCRMLKMHRYQDEREPYGIYCSECREFVLNWMSEDGMPMPNYCPSCGAKVVGE